MSLHHRAEWNDVGLLLDLAEHEADVGAEIAERETTVPGLMRAVGGHDPECSCHVCVEIAVDEDRLRYVRKGRW